MSHVIHRDLGANFLGFATQVADEMVCILTPQAASDARIQERVRDAMRSQGRDCGTCLGCPVGRAR